MITGFERHGWKKGTRILRGGTFKGTVMDDGEYHADDNSGLWYFRIKWDDGNTTITPPYADDEIIQEEK